MYEEMEEVVSQTPETQEEQPTQQTETEVQEQPAQQTDERKFTQQEVDQKIKDKLDEVLPGKIARREARIRKEYDRDYGELMGLLRAGTGKETVQDITEDLRQFYGGKGVKQPETPQYSQKDTQTLAKAEAEEIIRGGYDEVVEEVDRLARIGSAKLTPRERAVFSILAQHRQAQERTQELEKLGVTPAEYNSPEFQAFAGKFSTNTPIGEIYEIYQSTKPKKNYQTAGSVKHGAAASGVKDYYTPEEIARLTEKDLDDPKVWEAVRKSMTGQ